MTKLNQHSKFIGGILLIVGTSIGGGMLALPVANAAAGLWYSSFFLLSCWAIMTLGALFILEANLYVSRGKHMVSMAAETMGRPGILLSWLSYLFLLYTLLAGYISGGSDVFGSLAHGIGLTLAPWQSSLLFTLVFGLVVYGGIHQVDLLNRCLMFGKLGVYILLVFLISPHIKFQHFSGGDFSSIVGSVMILITSFGFAIIVPNLRDYFNDDIPKLRRVIIIGSLIPLVCYMAWDAVIMGNIPAQQLSALMHSEHTNSELAQALSLTVNNGVISSFFNFFTSICILTAFLGVALCLISFLADGLRVEQKGQAGLGLFLLTFAPPLLIVLYYPGAYIHAMHYAGIFCVILLLLLPVLMTIFGRKKFKARRYEVPGGVLTQALVLFFSVVLLGNTVLQLF